MPPETKEMSNNGGAESFGERVGSLPLVHLTVEKVQTYYQGTKERFPLVQTVQNFIPQITPQKYLSPKFISQIDQVACQGLDSLERNVPIIKEQPEKVMEMVQNNIYDPFDNLLQKALIFSEENLDRYLPPTEEEKEKEQKEEKEEEEKEEKEDEKDEELPKAKKQKFEGLQRAQVLGFKLSKRISSLALKKLSPDQMKKIISAVLENVESQTAILKTTLKEGNLLKVLDSHFVELRNSLNQLIESAPSADSISVLLMGISKNVSQFSDNLFLTLSKPFEAAKNENYLKIVTSLKEYADSMAKFAASSFPLHSTTPSKVVQQE